MTMDSGLSFLPMDSTAATTTTTTTTNRMMSRHYPLHTWGASILATIHETCTKAQNCEGPIGSMTKWITTLISPAMPIIYAIQCQWLAILSFADDNFLAVENFIETVFPPSTHSFNWINEGLHSVQALPKKFSTAMNKFPEIMHQFQVLDWVLTHLISWLNFLIITLTQWRSKNMKEKEIIVDHMTNNNLSAANWPKGSLNHSQFNNSESSFPAPDFSQDQTKTAEKAQESDVFQKTNMKEVVKTSNKPYVGKCTYKEVLKRGPKEKRQEESGHQESQESIINEEGAVWSREKDSNEGKKGFAQDDPILELYETSWHMNSGIGSKGSSFSSSFPRLPEENLKA